MEFLCGIPGSPISPTGDRLLVAFKVAVAALRQYLDLTRGSFVPRLLFRASEDRRGWSSIKLVYRTKRKVRPLEAGLMGPGAKGGSFGASMVVRVGVVVKILYFFFLGRSVYSLSLKILFFCCRC